MRRNILATHRVALTLAVLLASSLAAANSHIVVMEYEAWFGPHAVTFQSSFAMPLLRSADMQSVGGGYDSADPAVIKQHVAWMEYMGIDAVTIDLTNNVSSSTASARNFPSAPLENVGNAR